MIELVFKIATEIVIVKIQDKNLYFSNSQLGFMTAVPIDCINLDIPGILREFPDLEGMPREQIRMEAISRLKDKVKHMKTETEVKDYVIEEFIRMGYKLELLNRNGFRTKKYA